MIKEFKEFIMKGNVLDLAIAVIIGAAFGKVITSMVNDILMPPIGLVLGNVDFSSLFINLSGKSFNSLPEAVAAGAPTINYGVFLNTIINFLIIGLVVFLIAKASNQMKKPQVTAPQAPTTKECPYCLSAISIKASKCAFCTSDVKSEFKAA